MFLENCKVVKNENIAKNMFLLVVKSETAVSKTRAGQFFMLEVKNFLRRPISIHNVDMDKKELEFYYEVKGKGTNELSRLKVGDKLNIQGPLGNGFDTEVEGKNIVVVGGGMGIAPTKLLMKKLANNNIIFVAGGRSKDHLEILKNMELAGIEVITTTDDGTLGIKGRVDTVLEGILTNKKIDAVYTCGPEKMMLSVANISAKNKVKCYVSLEARMACGVKACVGCSIKTKIGMRKVCHDGPVFDSSILGEEVWKD